MALEVGTGQVHTKFTEYKKRQDFRSFLEGVLADQPQDKEIHVILDNYCTHMKNDDWLSNLRVASIFTSRRLPRVGRIKMRSSSACSNARHSAEPVSRQKISCAKPLKLSSKDLESVFSNGHFHGLEFWSRPRLPGRYPYREP